MVEIMEWIRIKITDKIIPHCINCPNTNVVNRVKGIYCCPDCCNVAKTCRYWCDLKHKCKGYKLSNPYDIFADLILELYKLQIKSIESFEPHYYTVPSDIDTTRFTHNATKLTDE